MPIIENTLYAMSYSISWYKYINILCVTLLVECFVLAWIYPEKKLPTAFVMPLFCLIAILLTWSNFRVETYICYKRLTYDPSIGIKRPAPDVVEYDPGSDEFANGMRVFIEMDTEILKKSPKNGEDHQAIRENLEFSRKQLACSDISVE